MNINQIMNLNFNARSAKPVVTKITRFRVPGKNGTTIVSDLTEVNNKYTKLEYSVMKNGKELEKRCYQNKKGFPVERFCCICDKLQTKVREGFDFLNELFEAQL